MNINILASLKHYLQIGQNFYILRREIYEIKSGYLCMDIKQSVPTFIRIWQAMFTLILLCVSQHSHAESTGGIRLNIEVTFGSHNISSRIGILAFGTAQQSNLAAELGAGLWAQTHLRRFGAQTTGWSIGYDAFGLVGMGDNSNLLGSALSESVSSAIFQAPSQKGFFGLGFGVIDEHISGSLSKFSLKRGKVIIRAASKASSVHMTFANDLRESIMQGGATDYGQTAAFKIQYNQIRNNSLTQYGLGFEVFTPQPDYNNEPNNPQNSAEGRRRVWYTTKPWDKLFNANLFFEFTRQDEQRSISAKIGLDSPKLGAYAQNKIHDSFGLLPRFPWPVDKKGQVFFEATASSRIR